jgi:hypothetical protein
MMGVRGLIPTLGVLRQEAGSAAPDEGGLAVPDAVRDLLAAFLATGAEPQEGLALVAQALGAQAALPLLAEWLRQGGAWRGVRWTLSSLDCIAELRPDLAQAGLSAWGAEWVNAEGSLLAGSEFRFNDRTWITALPEGLRVAGHLDLAGTGLMALPSSLDVGGNLWLNETPLTRLPDGFAVRGHLGLRGCRSLVALPQGLDVGDDLFLEGCAAWDGVIPPDAQVGNRIFSDRTPLGLSLPSWRRRMGR